jgi:hypothetical protein
MNSASPRRGPLTLLLLAASACSRPGPADASHRAPEPPPAAPSVSTARAESSGAAAATGSAAPSVSATAPASPPPERPKAGFIAFVDGAPWSARPVGYTAVLSDNAVSLLGGGSREPRQIALDMTRTEDGERILVHLDVTDDFVGKHAYVCRADKCSPTFEGQVYRAKGKGLLATKEPSAVEILKYETIGPQTQRISLWFDFKVEAISAPKGKPLRVVGVVEDAEITDVGKPVGLLAGSPSEMQPLPEGRLPADLRPSKGRAAAPR